MAAPRDRLSEVIPSAGRLIQSLRDLGYDLPTAVADLIDNSIAAGATSVDVDLHFEGETSWIRIVDDGLGMSRGRLLEAMRFGTRRDYDEDDLGKFGLGLKAASLSQCRCVTVASRTGLGVPLRIAQWDLDHVEDTDRWEILHPVAGRVPLASAPLQERVGTVVVWEDLDRIFRYRVPEGQRAHADFERVTADVAAHLSMVFHRFLAGTAARRLPLSISVNGRQLQPWDPFAIDEPETMRLPLQRLRFVHDGHRSMVVARPYVLPPEARFSSPAAHRAAAGPRFWNRQQGFYIYRADRMIQSGGWSRLRTQDEHSKLARVSIDLPPGAEELFELNISKTVVRIPGALRGDLSAIASNLVRLAQDVYRSPAPIACSPLVRRAPDPRARAINALVEMVVSAAETLLDQEMPSSAARSRATAALRLMQTRFAEELDAEVERERRPKQSTTESRASSA
jgi:Histidine kinase-, DNA gyrase B-, and HSP90-like ATPase